MRSREVRRPLHAGKIPGRIGVVARQPLLWAAATAVVAMAGGRRGRRAALRGAACYSVAAIVANGMKPLFSRPQPRHRFPRSPEVMRGSFPSGHAACEVAYTFAFAVEMPAAFLPLSLVAILAHWSLVRAGKHYVGDMLAGGTIGLAIAALSAKRWPPDRREGPGS